MHVTNSLFAACCPLQALQIYTIFSFCLSCERGAYADCTKHLQKHLQCLAIEFLSVREVLSCIELARVGADQAAFGFVRNAIALYKVCMPSDCCGLQGTLWEV